MIVQKMLSLLHHCEISDSFVHPNMKLSGGKNGHGEARLFLTNCKDIFEKITKKKKIKILFDKDYINNLESFVSDENNFITNIK